MINIFIEEFLKYLENQKNYSDKTIINYQLDLKKYDSFIKKNKIDYKTIDYPKIAKYLVYLNELGLKGSSRSRNLSALRSYYNYLLKEDKVDNNPFLLVSGSKKEKKLPNFLQYNELESILEQCGDDPLGIRNRLIIEMLIASGLRVSELVNIELEDIDISSKSIKVMGKGKKERIVYFGEYALKSLNDYLPNSRDILLRGKKSNKLFINHLGDDLTPRGVADIINRIIKTTAIERNVSPHTFRHSFATMMLNEGANTKVVQELLGHESMATTSIYTHVSNDRLRHEYLKAHPRARK